MFYNSCNEVKLTPAQAQQALRLISNYDKDNKEPSRLQTRYIHTKDGRTTLGTYKHGSSGLEGLFFSIRPKPNVNNVERIGYFFVKQKDQSWQLSNRTHYKEIVRREDGQLDWEKNELPCNTVPANRQLKDFFRRLNQPGDWEDL
jgi:hypothetical protein